MLLGRMPLRCYAVLLSAAVMCLCAAAQSVKSPAGVSPNSVKVGFLVDSLKVERWQTDVDTFQKRAQELGAEVLVEDAEGDDDLQYRQAQKLISAGVQVLVIVPHDTNEAVRLVAAAKGNNVVVVSYDRLIRNSDIDFFVGADSERIGELQAQSLVALVPKGNYVLIAGSPADNNAKLLRQGQLKVLKPSIDRGDIKVVGDVWTTDWRPQEAYVHMVEILAATQGNIAAVVASNDGTAGGAIQALQDHQLAGKVLVSGQDADLAAVIRLLDGSQTSTIYKPLRNEAQRAAEIAVRFAKGERVEAADSIFNGNRKIPAFFITPVVVTKNNVRETVIAHGFQNLETIKKSLPPDKWPR